MQVTFVLTGSVHSGSLQQLPRHGGAFPHLNIPSFQVAVTGLPVSFNNVLGAMNARDVSPPSSVSFSQGIVSVPTIYFPVSNGGCGLIVENVIHSRPS